MALDAAANLHFCLLLTNAIAYSIVNTPRYPDKFIRSSSVPETLI